MFFRRPTLPERVMIEIAGRSIEVKVRVSPRSRSYRLSLPASGRPVLSMPASGRWAEAENFLERQRDWLAARLDGAPLAPDLADGSLVPLRGIVHCIMATGKLRGQVMTADLGGTPIVYVPGEPAHLKRRLLDFYRTEARRDLLARTAIHAKTLGVTVSAITLRSQATRWGSCSSTGRLNYNWRLVAAPEFVLDYVCAHEVAHLVEMNHSAAFWATVSRALPDYGRGKAWLKLHGRALMALGAD